ncbi:GNAT family N-acetyltransferase [Deinococcus peraridilitoris]|uniref:Sortase-like acyltransferase n=1 Tax=Deinococcus peraridilitoris (strain DSM 19664 / LMG 22246 / CIP 109416 / KR-200) TaxID=937777 RepID=L0A4D1_DEIPD|nr:GNAT family N-acetyltransferase [Deinococcus peraridilitoris]AFZ68743.1 sortase-like acyltransferase [Deinococcus peraridilitoris DSM 19664]
MTATTERIRPFTAQDYEAYVSMLNAAHPEDPQTVEDVKLFDAGREPHETFARFLLDRGGQVVGSAVIGTPRYNPQPGASMLNLHLHPQAQSAAGQLYDFAVREAQALGARILVAGAREDWWELPFLQARGFVELDRMWGSTLDVREFDPAPFAAFQLKSAQQGIQVRPLAELPYQEEAFQRRWYALIIELLGDVPSASEFHPWPFETWQKRVAQSPKLVSEAYFMALDGEQLVGTSELFPSNRPGTLQTGLTGVRRAWRRKGIAQTLKLVAAEYARSQGFQFVRTSNHSVNRPMLSINEAMGFMKEPAWVNLERRL